MFYVVFWPLYSQFYVLRYILRALFLFSFCHFYMYTLCRIRASFLANVHAFKQ